MRRKESCRIIHMDQVGRLVLPMQLRSAMQLNGRAELEGEIDNETGEITLRPLKNRCRNCGTETDLHRLGTIVLCDRCIEELKNG